MNWDAISALGSIVGATTVFISLIYLAIQVRQNTQVLNANKKVTSALIIQERSKMFISTHQLIQDSPFMAPILAKLENADHLEDAVSQLDTDEMIRLRGLAMEAFIRLETQLHLYQEGMLDENYFTYNTRSSIRARYPLWKALGILDEFDARPEILEMIDNIVRDSA